MLDLERCKYVGGDDCVDSVLAFKQIIDLNLFDTGFDVSQLARILEGSKNSLRHLQRGDFLAEAVEAIAEGTRLKVEEFWASEDYYFHTRQALLLQYHQ